MRDVLRVLLLGWLTAVMVVAPVVAALDCRACCNEREATRPAVPEKSCCAAHAKHGETAQTEEDDDCSHCPRCEASRPDPVTLPEAAPELVVLAIPYLDLLPRVVDGPRLAAAVARPAEVPIAASPPARVLFCCWLT